MTITEIIATEIIALDRAWEDAIIQKNADEMARLAADDLIYTHAGCSIDDKPGMIDHIMNGELTFVSVDYEDIQVRAHGDMAVLTCALHLDTLDKEGKEGELHFRTTHVWILEKGRWQLLANQSTHIPQA